MKSQLVYGTHPVTALLEHQPERIKRLFVANTGKSANAANSKSEQRVSGVTGLATRYGIAVEPVSSRWLEENLPGVPHQRLVAEYMPLPPRGVKELQTFVKAISESPQLLLVLDNILDPHNLGACLRVASGMGVNAVILPANNSAGLTAAAHKSAAGAAAMLPLFQVSNLARALQMLKDEGYWLYGAAGEADSVASAVEFSTSSVIIMGGEGGGLRARTRDLCDIQFSIPMFGSLQSLNVSVAAGIALYAVRSHWSA